MFSPQVKTLYGILNNANNYTETFTGPEGVPNNAQFFRIVADTKFLCESNIIDQSTISFISSEAIESATTSNVNNSVFLAGEENTYFKVANARSVLSNIIVAAVGENLPDSIDYYVEFVSNIPNSLLNIN